MDEGKLLAGLFDACRGELERAAETWRQATIVTLDETQASADSLQVASRLFHAQRALDPAQPSLPRRLVQRLEACMVERLGGAPPTRRRRAAIDEMALVDDDVVNESIEVSRIVGRIQLEAEWDVRGAEDALSRRLGRAVIGERASPFHPEAFGRAVWRLTEDLALTPDERAACLRAGLASIAAFARAVCGAIARACGEGPGADTFVIQHGQSSVAVELPVDVSLGALSEAPAAPAPAVHARTGPAPLDARDHVFRGVNASIEQVLGDPRLSPELRRVLGALQLATLRLALASPEVLYAPRHAIWSVVPTLADYALAHCVNDRLAHDDFVLFADDEVRTLLRLEPESVGDLGARFDTFARFAEKRTHHLVAHELHAIQHFARLEDSRRKILGVALNRHRERLTAMIGASEMPFRLRQFLLADWAEVLARTELADGPDSSAFAEYLYAARRVIDRVGSPGGPAADNMNALLALLERGMASVALPSVEKHELAAALTRPAATAWADSERHAPAGRRARAFWRAGGQAASDAGPITEGMASAMPAGDAQQWIDALRVGAVVEMFLVGAWMDARVTGIGANGTLFTFEDDAGGRSHSLTRRALLRLVREGLASSP